MMRMVDFDVESGGFLENWEGTAPRHQIPSRAGSLWLRSPCFLLSRKIGKVNYLGIVVQVAVCKDKLRRWDVRFVVTAEVDSDVILLIYCAVCTSVFVASAPAY